MAVPHSDVEIRSVGVVGAGVMGIGIAETLAAAGVSVSLFDQQSGKADESLTGLKHRHDARVAAGKVKAETVQSMLGRISVASTLEKMASADLVIEAIVEKLEPKKALIAALERILPETALIATNTSSLSVTAIAAGAQHPARIAGFHFFNPAPLMKVVEVIAGAFTSDGATKSLSDLALKMGHRPVTAKDTPGFVVNHAGRAFGTEALAMLRENVAPVAAIDAILRDAAGFRMGPFELMDLTGLDVTHPVMEGIYNEFYQDPRYRPSVITRQRYEAGILGRKTGRGFYVYENGKKVETAGEVSVQPGELPRSVRLLDDSQHGHLRAIATAAGCEIVDDTSADLTLVGLRGEDATGATRRLGTNAQSTLGVDIVFGLDRHRTLVASPATSAAAKMSALALLRQDGTKATLVDDSCGAVCQRVVAMIVNIASEIVEQQIASAGDVDQAVKLGLGYPNGPLEWGDAIGPFTVVTILDTIYDRTRDPRYRASLWLRRRAELGIPLTQTN